MFAQKTDYENPMTMVMGSGIQFVDFVLRLDELRREQPGEFGRAEPDEPLARLKYDEGADIFYHPARPGKAVKTDYSVAIDTSLALLEGLWLPLPVFRTSPPRRFDIGPINWVRARLVALPEADVDGNTHRVTLAFDTKLLSSRDDSVYLAPSETDVRTGATFALAYQSDEMGWFLGLGWVDGWLREVFSERSDMHPEDIEEECKQLYHQAHYLNFLHLLGTALSLPEIKLVRNQDKEPAPIAVDLVLDVGNARTCGILIEDHPQEADGLGKRYELYLRDLSRPDQVYLEPFESRVEFAQAVFGKDHFSMQSGRRDAFQWPTIARVGPEARRLAARRRGTEGSTGLSSPKRYLWDEDNYESGWRFNCAYVKSDVDPLATAAPIASLINESGQALYDLAQEERMPVFHPHYSRSSLMCFMLSEVLAHALAQINSPAQRLRMRHARVPRHLRSIILTVPPAMPKPEREIFAKWMEQAVGLVWKANGWHAQDAPIDFNDKDSRAAAHPPLPEVHVQWDEATCAQVVYLFNETQHNFAGHPEDFFAAMRRPQQENDKQLSIASIDIGGGTSDLAITEYRLDEGQGNNVYIKPEQRFRDGFKIAGDDILLDVITLFLLPALEQALQGAGVGNPNALLSRLIGSEKVSVQEAVLRQQITLQVFVPLGLALLKAYEQYDPLDIAAQFSGTFGSLLDETPAAPVLDGFAAAVRRAPGKLPGSKPEQPFDVLAVPVAISLRHVHEAFINESMHIAKTLKALCEVLNLYSPDVLLLTGRSSLLPGVRALLHKFLPLPPSRIVPLHHYHTGGWYPFHREGRIEDPKTTAAVGAMLCLLARNLRLPNFFFRAADFRLYSTMKYLGQIDNDNLIKNSTVFFRDIDLDDPNYQLPDITFEMRGTLRLGFRQLDSERWTAAPLYLLSIENARLREQVASRGLVLKVRFGVKPSRKRDQGSETFEFLGAESDNGAVSRSHIRLRLNTLTGSALETDYWLDSGSVFHK